MLALAALPYGASGGWSGGGINELAYRLTYVQVARQDLPAGFDKYEYNAGSGVYKLAQYDEFIIPPGVSRAGQRQRHDRIELVFSVRYPCDHHTKAQIEQMARVGSPCEPRKQVEQNLGTKEYPLRPAVPIGDIAAIKDVEHTYCKSGGPSSRYIPFGIAIGDILVTGHIIGDAASYGTCPIVKPVPSREELFGVLQTLANNLRKYVGKIPPLTGQKGQPRTQPAPPPSPAEAPAATEPTPGRESAPSRPAPATGWRPGATPEAQAPPGRYADAETPTEPAGSRIVSPAEAAGAAIAVGTLAGMGALLMLWANGIGWREVAEGARDVFGQGPVEVSEEAAVAEPAAAAAIEEPVPQPPPAARDGDVNEYGEVWSDEDGGWVSRNLYEEEQARRGWLADKRERDWEAMHEQDASVREAYEDWQQARAAVAQQQMQGEALEVVWTGRDWLDERIDTLMKAEAEGGLDDTRRALLQRLKAKAGEIEGMEDHLAALAELDSLADLVDAQATVYFTPTYTYTDAVVDTVVQAGAAALDATVTRGYASATVSTALRTRDALREGASVSEALYEGGKAGAIDLAFGKVMNYFGGKGGIQPRGGGGAVSTAAKEGIEEAEQAVLRSGAQIRREMADTLEGFEKNITRVDGKLQNKLDDVLEMQRDPQKVRYLKKYGSAEAQKSYNNTLRQGVYKPHDRALVQRIKEANPELANKKVMVSEIRTPGKKASPINTDRDFRVLYRDDKGQWLELPKEKWEQDSHEIFSKLTGYDPKKCPPHLEDDAARQQWWAEQHDHTPTDKFHEEASVDYSRQIIDANGRRIRVDKPTVAELKEIADNPDFVMKSGQPAVKLKDPDYFGDMFNEKIQTNLRKGNSYEAIAQAKKGVETLDKVRSAYQKQGLGVGEVSDELKQAMTLIQKSELDVIPDPAELAKLNKDLNALGIRGLDDFGRKLGGQLKSLKLA
jgi:hypothetical protein